jgi:rubrerythrin
VTHHIQGKEHSLEQTLNDAIAVERLVVEADRRLANECPPELKPKFEKMSEDDNFHAENFRRVLTNYGGQETGPSEFTSKLMDSCREVFDSSEPFLRKLGAYNLLKDKVLSDAMATAVMCYATGDRDCEQTMALNITENMAHQVTLGGNAIDMIAVKAESMKKGEKAA